jgi:uncharacterized DUF497 family protein
LIDFGLITGFEWDKGNERKSVDAHQVAQFEAEELFFNQPLIVTDDPAHSAREPRWHALGVTDRGRLLHVTFTLRQTNTKIRVISARDMSRRERQIYEKQN